MAIDTTSPRTRRAVLLGAAGAVAATTLGAVARPIPALAAGDDGQIIHVGDYWADARTSTLLVNTTNDNRVFAAESFQGGDGIYGESASGNGVYGHSDSGRGVYGESPTGTAIAADANSGMAVSASATSGVAVSAATTTGTAVSALTNLGVAVDAYSRSSIGVRGESGDNSGVSGYSSASDFPAVGGWSAGSNTGVYGFTGGGLPGPCPRKTGVYGLADVAGGTGVVGRAPGGRGGQFAGGKAQVRLVPSAATTHPTSGATGDLFLDKSARLWLCIKGGNPATWKQVSLV